MRRDGASPPAGTGPALGDAPLWRVATPPRVGVSSCLLGQAVRYDGGHARDRFLTDRLSRYVEWVPVCPEVEVGMGVPRPALHLVAVELQAGERNVREGGLRLVSPRDGRDHTDAMTSYARRRAAALREAGLSGYVFKSRSPSCGLFRLPIYSHGRVSRRDARGLFSGEMLRAMPRLPAEEEGRLNDPVLRENFVERVFAHARLRDLFAGPWRLADLADFHARHKLQLLAHDPARLRRLGRLVANGAALERDDLSGEYADGFLDALATPASRGRNADALLHALGFLRPALDRGRRDDVREVIDAYRHGTVPLSVPVTLIRHHTRAVDGAAPRAFPASGAGYLRVQTYLEPFPGDLGLRNHT